MLVLVVFCCWVSVLLLRVKRVMNAYLSTSSAVLILCKNINKMTARISDFPARRGVASSASGPQLDDRNERVEADNNGYHTQRRVRKNR